MFRLLTSILTATAAVFFMASCAQKALTTEELGMMSPEERTTSMLQQPKADDLYVANLADFSEFSFGEGGDAFGLLRVINVTSEAVVVVTEDAAWEEPGGAIEDLNGDFSDVTWDSSEEVTVLFADLIMAQETGSILEARRLTAEEIEAYLN